ncbi:MAG: methyltransferase domain-containing protein [Oscillospiraceae bacterium]|nr:methyltransferase domain-containing protein [Oscillospiraceae bacterium]
MITNKTIDNGKPFDWGRTSGDYAKYRDIYPDEFYEKLHSLGIGISGQRVLDIGTGTGVIPRNMYRYGAHFTGTDISENQIIAARRLAENEGMDIRFLCKSTEELDFPDESFEAITACQCFFYFDHGIAAPKLAGMLPDGGKLAVLYMGWLPYEDEVAGASEELILKFNPGWTGRGDMRHEIFIPEIYSEYFNMLYSEIFDVKVHFTRESWNGRIKACRGIGASLSENKIAAFENEHLALLQKIAPEDFDVLHYCAFSILEKK